LGSARLDPCESSGQRSIRGSVLEHCPGTKTLRFSVTSCSFRFLESGASFRWWTSCPSPWNAGRADLLVGLDARQRVPTAVRGSRREVLVGRILTRRLFPVGKREVCTLTGRIRGGYAHRNL